MQATDRFLPPALRAVGLLGCTVLLCLPAWAQQQPTKPGSILVSDIIVQGNKRMTSQAITDLLEMRAGAEYQPEVLHKGIRTLMATKQFTNVQSVIVPEADGHRVKVYLIIRELPTTVQKVTYLGQHHIEDDELEKITGIHQGMPLDPAANKLACQAIVRRLVEDGRRSADCTLVSGDKPGDTEVIFRITEGNQVQVRDIEFVGNQFVSGGRLATQITSNKFPDLTGLYTPGVAEDDVARLVKYYQNFGYIDVKISRILKYDPDGKTVVLVFYINEGPRYRTPPKTDLNSDANRIKDWSGSGNKVKAMEEKSYNPANPGLIKVHYEVEEVGPFHVGAIYISGSTVLGPTGQGK